MSYTVNNSYHNEGVRRRHGKITKPEIKDIISEVASIKLPKVELDKDDYFWSGWTEDWIYGYEPGDVFVCRKKNVTLNPVFGLLADKRTFTLQYIVEFEQFYFCNNDH